MTTRIPAYIPGDPAVVRCPYPYYDHMRAEAPVYAVPGRNDYFITRFQDVEYVAKHPELFSSHRQWVTFQDPDLLAIYQDMPCPIVPTMTDNDPPGHTLFRQIGFRAFTPRRLREREEAVRGIVDALIDRFAAKGQVDFVSEFADQLPMRVIALILGLPAERFDDYKRWSDHWAKLSAGYASKEQALVYQRSAVEWYQFIAGQVDARYARPSGDVISEFIGTTSEDGEKLDRTGVINLVRLLHIAGNETTAMNLAHTMRILTEKPDLMARVIADHGYIRRVLEESLRVEGPVQWMWREAVREIVLHGVTIPKGARVLVSWAAANRDEGKWENAAEFDADRPNLKDHVAFGEGIHFCLGAPLARLEITIAFDRLLSRLSNIRRTDPTTELQYLPSPSFRGLRELPLSFGLIETAHKM